MPTRRWAPAEVLDLDSISSGFTCVGYVKSKGRQCRNAIAFANRQEAVKILREMSRLDPQSPRLDDKLEELATRLLCKRWHRDQAVDMKEQWQDDIEDYVATEAARREEESRQQTHTDPAPPSPHGPSSQATHRHGRNPSPLSLPAEELAARQQTHTDPAPPSPHGSSSQATHHHERHPSPTSLPADELAALIPGAFPREVEGDCSICHEDLIGGGATVHCRAQCRQNFHADCIDLWHAVQEVDRRRKNCPYW